MIGRKSEEIIKNYAEEAISEKLISEENLVRSLSDKVEDIIFKRIKIITICIGICVTTITFSVGFYGITKFGDIRKKIESAEKNASEAEKKSSEELKIVNNLDSSIKFINSEVNSVKVRQEDNDIQSHILGLGVKKGLFLGMSPFKNSIGKKVILINIDPNASGNYSAEMLRIIKNEIENKGFSVVFGCFQRVVFRQCIMINSMIPGIGNNTTLFFDREALEVAKFVQDEFSKTSPFKTGPIFENYKNNSEFSDDMKYVLEKANVYISVDIFD